MVGSPQERWNPKGSQSCGRRTQNWQLVLAKGTHPKTGNRYPTDVSAPIDALTASWSNREEMEIEISSTSTHLVRLTADLALSRLSVFQNRVRESASGDRTLPRLRFDVLCLS